MSAKRSSGAVILCIDDDREILNLLGMILAGAGYMVIKAEGGKQGLIEARNRRPDLILLDVMMPEIDGYIVCSQLQANPGTVFIPVIFLTALDGEVDRAKAFAVGAADYISKPVQKDILLTKVGEQLKSCPCLTHLLSVFCLSSLHNQQPTPPEVSILWLIHNIIVKKITSLIDDEVASQALHTCASAASINASPGRHMGI